MVPENCLVVQENTPPHFGIVGGEPSNQISKKEGLESSNSLTLQ